MVGLSLSVCVCVLVAFVSPAKSTKPIELPFGLLIRVGPRNHALDEVCQSPKKGQF